MKAKDILRGYYGKSKPPFGSTQIKTYKATIEGVEMGISVNFWPSNRSFSGNDSYMIGIIAHKNGEFKHFGSIQFNRKPTKFDIIEKLKTSQEILEQIKKLQDDSTKL